MKIQDIFKLPNIKGKNKLFNKIMNKYGIPKEDSKELKTNIDNFSSGGEGSNIEYFAYEKDTIQALAIYAQYFKVESISMEIKAVMPYSIAMSEFMAASNATVIAIGIDLSKQIIIKQGDVLQQNTILEALQINGVTEEEIAALPRITKEEFYKLD